MYQIIALFNFNLMYTVGTYTIMFNTASLSFLSCVLNYIPMLSN